MNNDFQEEYNYYKENSEYYNNNRIKKKRKKSKNYLLRIFIIVVILIALAAFLLSDIFNVEKISTSGLTKYQENTIIKMSNMNVGDNIFTIKDSAGIKRVEALPYIRGVRINRILPDEVIIEVEEREPIAVVQYDGKYILLDKEMFFLEIVEEVDNVALIENIVLKESEIGEKVLLEEELILEKSLELIYSGYIKEHSFEKVEVIYNTETETLDAIIYITEVMVYKGEYYAVLGTISNGYLMEILNVLESENRKRGTLTMSNDGEVLFSPELE